jgi:hypothetical protein
LSKMWLDKERSWTRSGAVEEDELLKKKRC